MRLEIPEGKLLVMWDKEKQDIDGSWVEDYHYGYIETILRNATAIIVDVYRGQLEQVPIDAVRVLDHLPPPED